MRILIAGDFCITGRAVPLVIAGDFSFLDSLREVTKTADFSIANFEGPITDNSDSPILKCGPNLKMPKEAVKAFAYAGFNVATLANNHILDYDKNAMNNTVRILRENNVETVGVGRDLSKASEYLILQVGNHKVAIINCCEHEFSIASDNEAGANPINPIKLFYDIKQARQYADNVIVITHGGHEFYNLPSIRMQDLYRYLIDCGADVVVNHHQHCFSGYEQYNGKMIFYGLGNLCFDRKGKSNDIWNTGYAVLFTIEDSISYKIIPYNQFSEKPEIKILEDGTFDMMIENLNTIISNRALLKENQEKYFNRSSKYLRLRFEPINNKIIGFLRNRGLFPYFMDAKNGRYRKSYSL